MLPTDPEKIKQMNDIFKENRIYAFNTIRTPQFPELREANPLQTQLIEAWKNPTYKVFTYTGGNRIGKCVTYETLIETPDGEITIGKLFENRKPFKVYAWDGNKKVVAQAKAPFKKEGVHQCYRITLENGRWIEAADKHRVFCSDGQYRNVATLASLFPSYRQDIYGDGQPLFSKRSFLRESSLESGLSVLPSGAVYLSERQLDYLQNCSVSYRQYDEQPQTEEVNDLIFSPLPNDVQRPDVPVLHGDGQGNKYTSNFLSVFSRLSILGVLHRFVGQFFETVFHAAYKTLIPFLPKYQLSQQFSTVGVSGLQQGSLIVQRQSLSYDSYNPPLRGGNRIISIKPIGVKCCYDFEVEKYHNYFAGGLINHNTTIGAILAICTILGEWPWSGEKIKFPHSEPRKIRYIGQAWESHVKAVVEPALKFWWPKRVPVETRKNNQGVEYLWVSGKRGSIEILSNVQDSDVFEGWNGDLVIYDEPPKRNVRVAAARGLIDRKGRELFCMTLLKEAWISREVINATLPNGEPDMSVFNITGDIYSNVGYGITKEGIDQFAKTLTEDEKKARLYGNPSYMSSLVFPRFKRHTHVKERFKIPLDALIDIQIDFHPSKKWAVVFLATLKNGFKYVCDEIWDRGNPKYIAEEIVRRIRERSYERINSIGIDPLAKGGEGNDIDVYTIMSESLASRNYPLETASKDKDVGIAIVNNLLWTENEMPGLFFFKDCVKTIEQTENLMYDPETLKPQKTDDDFTECLYRCALKNTEWYAEYEHKTRYEETRVML